MTYKFIREDEDRYIEHIVTNVETWDELLPYMMDWLKGCGFVFDANARLGIVHDHPYTPEELLGGGHDD